MEINWLFSVHYRSVNPTKFGLDDDEIFYIPFAECDSEDYPDAQMYILYSTYSCVSV